MKNKKTVPLEMVLTVMEWGFNAHEKGWNLEKARAECGKMYLGLPEDF